MNITNIISGTGILISALVLQSGFVGKVTLTDEYRSVMKEGRVFYEINEFNERANHSPNLCTYKFEDYGEGWIERRQCIYGIEA